MTDNAIFYIVAAALLATGSFFICIPMIVGEPYDLKRQPHNWFAVWAGSVFILGSAMFFIIALAG